MTEHHDYNYYLVPDGILILGLSQRLCCAGGLNIKEREHKLTIKCMVMFNVSFLESFHDLKCVFYYLW